VRWPGWLRRAPQPQLSEIRESFNAAAADEEHFPSTIDPRILHVKLILEYLGDVREKRVIDIGCGKGRFARIVKEKNPSAFVVGLDLAEAMLRFVPSDVKTCSGSMTALPFPDAAFDAVYATESLEHAVDIEKAVSEMCRIATPGGKIVIIDKNAEHWGRLKTPSWEKWFHREELEKLLRRDCRQVSSRFLSYWEDVEPDGLFLAWMAEK
jgi:ubiquinone/menaquinone biosynthesis C-methylase UbiE